MHKFGYCRLSTPSMALLMMLASTLQTVPAQAQTRASEFTLSNGMQVVVIPDHRAPVVTHMVWYKVGAADEPKGVSGIAHFLEHLMFKSTEKIAIGEFSKIISRLGGQDNAFTGQDATSYHQRIAKERLGTLMEMEADRMVNLRLTENEVLMERNVIMEERRARIENNPTALLDEQMSATLYRSHPYGNPVIGWGHEMKKLSREDAMRFYKHYYAPNNSILVVAGDVTTEEVKKLAEETLEYKDPRAGNASFHRYYVLPSYVTAEPGEAEALDLLFKIVAGGATSRLYKKLVVDEKIAATCGGNYAGWGLDSGAVSIYAVAADGVGLDDIEAKVDEVLEDVRANGVTAAELERAKKTFLANYIYDSDNQARLARRYGWALTVGRSVNDIESWPDAISKVTLEDVQKAAAKYLDIRRSVTGWLLPEAAQGQGDGGKKVKQPAVHTRS